MERMDQTLTKLRELISSDGVGGNGRIPPERILANELGVGRRSLRRALDILEQEGRITRQQGRGTFVQAPASSPLAAAVPFDQIIEHTNPLEAIEVRLSVEPVMARLAALRARHAGFGILCSDHGTAYQDDGYVGHRLGHPVVWTVPYAEIRWEKQHADA